MYYDGDHCNGSKFTITLNSAEYLNGYNQVIGELVDGEGVLSQMEESLTRHGDTKDVLKIENCGKF